MNRKVFGEPSFCYLEIWKNDFVRAIDIGVIPILLSIKIFKHGYIGFSITLFDYLDFEICLGTRSKEKLNN